MNLSPKAPVLLLALLCATASLGQDSAAPPRAPAPAPPPAAAEAEAEDEAPPPAERPDVDDDEFIPTEELAPDAAVTFPVDI
jgi:hypothetical protein